MKASQETVGQWLVQPTDLLHRKFHAWRRVSLTLRWGTGKVNRLFDSGRHAVRDKPVACSIAALLLVGVLGLTPGCSLLRAPTNVVNAVVPGKSSIQADLVDEQIQLQRFADDSLARTGQALDECVDHLGTDTGRAEVLRLKLVNGSSLISVVSGPNPSANLLDLASVTVLTRMSVQDYWTKRPNGAAFQPWLDVSRVLESNVWVLAARFIKPDQVNELRLGINQWYARTPEVRTAFFARPQEFASMVRATKEGAEGNSVFNLVNLDPTAGLDPAIREVTRTRLFAERAMFTMQRMPFLLRLQTELLAYELAAQPSVQLVLSNSSQLSESANRIGRTAESIGQSVAQLPDRLTAERKEILASLDVQSSKLQELVAGVDRALVSGEKLSSSLTITVTNVDALMKRFGAGEPNTNAPPPATNVTPFNILDYAKTADQIGNAVKELNSLVGSINQNAPELQRLSRETGTDLQKVVDHGFWLALILIVVLLGGAVAGGVVYRLFAQKIQRVDVAREGAAMDR